MCGGGSTERCEIFNIRVRLPAPPVNRMAKFSRSVSSYSAAGLTGRTSGGAEGQRLVSMPAWGNAPGIGSPQSTRAESPTYPATRVMARAFSPLSFPARSPGAMPQAGMDCAVGAQDPSSSRRPSQLRRASGCAGRGSHPPPSAAPRKVVPRFSASRRESVKGAQIARRSCERRAVKRAEARDYFSAGAVSMRGKSGTGLPRTWPSGSPPHCASARRKRESLPASSSFQAS